MRSFHRCCIAPRFKSNPCIVTLSIHTQCHSDTLPLAIAQQTNKEASKQSMDPTLPCIVQALRAVAVPTSTQLNPATPAASFSSRTQSQPSISRCTRSRAAPDWTVSDTLVLIEQIAAVDAELWSKTLSSFQKWKIVSDNCAQIGFNRSSNQCKRRWELLVSGQCTQHTILFYFIILHLTFIQIETLNHD